MVISFLTEMFNIVFSTSDKRVAHYIWLICFLKKRSQPMLGLIVSRRLQRKYGVFLPYYSVFNSTLTLRHPTGVVIGEGVEIGDNVTIFQNVTIGRSDTNIDGYPNIGDNCIIYAGAVILGKVRVGNNCVIGANTVVTKDVPDNSVAIGAPAKILPK